MRSNQPIGRVSRSLRRFDYANAVLARAARGYNSPHRALSFDLQRPRNRRLTIADYNRGKTVPSRGKSCEKAVMDAAARSMSSLDLQKLGKDSARAESKRIRHMPDRIATDHRAPRLRCPRSGVERSLRARRQADARIPVFQFLLALGKPLSQLLTRRPPRLKLSIVTGRRNGRLIMIWPLVSERVRGVTQTFWMGNPVSQYGDVLLDGEADALPVMRAGLEFLRARSNSDLLRLRRVRSDANVAPLMGVIDAQVTDRQTRALYGSDDRDGLRSLRAALFRQDAEEPAALGASARRKRRGRIRAPARRR